MAQTKNPYYCEECGEFINREDFMSCEKCGVPLHIWCTKRRWCENYPGEYFCDNCTEELDKEDNCIK